MKKTLIYMAGLAVAGLLAASCNKTVGTQADGTVDVAFNVALASGAQTKVDGVSEAVSVNELNVFVYDKNGAYLSGVRPEITQAGDNKHYTVKVRLMNNVTYNFVFFAQKAGTYTLPADKKTLTIDYSTIPANADAYDAFYARKNNYTVNGASFTESITLYRPFAQINFGSLKADYQAAEASQVAFDATLKTWISMEQVPTVLNLLDGTVGTPKDLAFQSNAWIGNSTPTKFLTVTGFTEVRYVEMAYVLAAPAPQGQLGKVILNIEGKQNGNDFTATRTVTNVPYCRNYRTHVVGNVFTDEGTFNVIVEPTYDDNLNKDL